MDEFFAGVFGLLSVIFAFAIFIGFVVAIVFVVKKSQEQQKVDRHTALKNKLELQEMVNTLPQDKQTSFMIEYRSRKKDATTAALLAIFLGAFGAHKFYLGNVTMGVVYLIFCWTYIPGILGIIEAFTISKKVELVNTNTAHEIMMLLGGMRGINEKSLL